MLVARMVLYRSFSETFSWICDGEELNLGSSCTQRTIVEAINLLFLSVFLISLLATSIRKHSRSSVIAYKRDRVFPIVSALCALISIPNFGLSLQTLLSENSEHTGLSSWWICLLRGLSWACLSVSLVVVRRTGWEKHLCPVWWSSFFFLTTALNIETLSNGQSFGVLESISWPVNFLLLVCAFRNYIVSVPQPALDPKLAEPLLAAKPDGIKSGLGYAGFPSKLVFSWVNPLLKSGFSKPLQFEDIPSLVSEDEANVAYRNFARTWASLTKERSSMSESDRGNLVIKTITRVHLKENILIGFYALLRTISIAVSPLILYAFVKYSSRDEEDSNLSQGFVVIVGCLILSKLVESLSQRHWFFGSRRSGMRMRSALMAALYEKQLKLSSSGRRRHSTGEIVNYIAVDAYRMGEFPWWFHSMWSLAFQLFLSIGVLFLVIGIGALPGLVPLVVFGLLNIPFAKILQNCQTKFMNAQDERLRATSEILNNMKIIKLQSWEEKFKNSIDSRRDEEFKWLSESQIKRAYGTALYWMSPTVISSVVFVGCVLLGSAPLDAGTIFTVLATLRIIAEPVRVIPEALSALIQVKVSFDRMNTFLLDDELKGDRIKHTGLLSPSPDTNVEIASGSFTWNTEAECPTLQNIDFQAKVGQKIAVCGPVGAGKSSLLYAILGEIVNTSGTVSVNGSIAYVSQASWIQSGTVRDNILFGKPMDEERYEMAVKSCALDKDISSFDHGDLTEIGQRGINMSGGQKQRIQLARAVYSDADIYLLDDPFSAVDAHTAATLFNDCAMSALRNKTVILVTHQVEFLSEVDRIMVMEGGKITHSGSYPELLTAGTTFEQLVNAHKEAVTALEASNNSDTKERRHEPPPESTKNGGGAEISEKGLAGTGPQLTEDEERETGDVGLKPFFDYFQVSGGTRLLVLASAGQLAFVGFQAAATYWLAVAIRFPDIRSSILIGVYAGISTLSAVFVYLRSFTAAHMGLKASKAFFSGFNSAIFRAPMLFFDSTPVGRILTRASSDFSTLDFDIPFSLIFVISSGLELIAIIAIMASVTWQVLIVAILASVASKYVQDYYLASARELIRINGTTKAPVMNYASETSLGAVTVRAFDMVNRFFDNFVNLIDLDAKLFFHSNAVMEWLVLRIEALQYVTLCTAAVFLILLPKGTITTGLVGLSLSYALSLTNTQVFLTRWYCSTLNYIVSVERIKQFMHIPSEPEAIVEDHRPPPSWPSKGRIELEDLKLRYRPNTPLVLKGITCTFKEGSRVGVVGRTGSGKTTLISALFRLVDPASGRICIDRIDITSIGLKDLRMKLSIIPQEPTLFRGSVRTNMDPLGLYSDHEIWQALEKCQLKATIGSLPNQLDSSVSDEGENWSAGQRQLFCLGRVLLRRNRILVLDEATASIDSATDAVLQRIIRQDFQECTVITVAHRVPTVIDSDKVMVLSFGRMVEYDEPSKLMESNSYFSKLVEEYWASCRKNSSQNLAP